MKVGLMESDFSTKLIADLLHNDKYSDVKIVVEGEQFNLHKCILAQSSSFFDAKVSQRNYILLLGISKKLFKSVINFIYTGKVDKQNLTKKEVIDLILLSKKYQLTELTKILQCDIDLSGEIREVIAYCDMASKCGLKELKEQTLNVIDSRAKEIVEENIISDIPLSILSEITKRDTFEIDELELFRLITKWKTYHPKTDGSDVLANVRLNLVRPEDVAMEVLPSGLLSSDHYLSSMIRKAPKRVFKAMEADETKNEELLQMLIKQEPPTNIVFGLFEGGTVSHTPTLKVSPKVRDEQCAPKTEEITTNSDDTFTQSFTEFESRSSISNEECWPEEAKKLTPVKSVGGVTQINIPTPVLNIYPDLICDSFCLLLHGIEKDLNLSKYKRYSSFNLFARDWVRLFLNREFLLTTIYFKTMSETGYKLKLRIENEGKWKTLPKITVPSIAATIGHTLNEPILTKSIIISFSKATHFYIKSVVLR